MTDSSTFDGYRITQAEMARGGTGVIHDAVAPDGTRVALKIFEHQLLEKKLVDLITSRKPGLTEEEVKAKVHKSLALNIDRFKAEYQVLTTLSHPNISRVYRIGFYEGSFYIAYEFIEGKPIAEYTSGKKPTEVLPLFVQALEGLNYIHRNGIIHLDIKSENILVQEGDGKPKVKFIDFGLAMAPTDYQGNFLGTVDTMAPEVALGRTDVVDARADLFSFGMVMYQCITWGRFPYARSRTKDRKMLKTLMEREANLTPRPPSRAHHSRPGYVPEYLDTIVMRLIAHKPEDRFYGNSRAVINALITHAPDAFSDSEDSRGAYLKPDKGVLVGRESEKQILDAELKVLLIDRYPDHPFIRMTGGNGLGKTHLLGYLKAQAEQYVEKVSVHSIAFPMDDNLLQGYLAQLTQAIVDNKKPVLMLIDDIHECSSHALDGLANLIRERTQKPEIHSGERPILLVVADRSGKARLDSFSREPESMTSLTMELEPFSRNDVEQYLKSAPAFKNVPELSDYATKLHHMTSGIPGEIVDTLQGLDNQGMVFDAGGRIVMVDINAAHKQKLAESTKDRLLSIYNSLAPVEREVVDIVACWRCRPFLRRPGANEIARIVSGNIITAVQTMHALTQRSILVHHTHDDTYFFTHGEYMARLVHETMDPVMRGEHHDDIARYFANPVSGSDAKHVRHSLWFHRGYGTIAPLAVRSLIRLGKVFLYERGDSSLACEFFEDALKLSSAPEDLKLKIYTSGMLCESLFYADRVVDAERVCRNGISIAETLGKQPLIRFLKTKLIPPLIAQKRYDEALSVIESDSDARKAERIDPLALTMLNYKARIQYEQAVRGASELKSGLSQAKKTYKKSEALEETLGLHVKQRIGNNFIGLVLKTMGDTSEAVDKLEKHLAKIGSSIFLKYSFLMAIAESYRLLRNFKAALPKAAQALELARRMKAGKRLLRAHEVIANIHHDMDRFDLAIDEYRRALAVSSMYEDKAGHTETSTRLWLSIGHCYKEIKQWNDAIIHFEAAMDGGAQGIVLMSSCVGAGEAYYNMEDYKKSADHLDKAEELLTELPVNASTISHAFRLNKIRMEILLHNGETAKAAALLQELENNTNGDENRRKERDEMEKKVRQETP